jgi:hypothetical protein
MIPQGGIIMLATAPLLAGCGCLFAPFLDAAENNVCQAR